MSKTHETPRNMLYRRSWWPRRLRRRSAGLSHAGIAVSNPTGSMNVSQLWVLRNVGYRSLRWADPSCREVLQSVWSSAGITPHTYREWVRQLWLKNVVNFMINIELITQIYCPQPFLEIPVFQETSAFNGKRMFTAAFARTEDLFLSPVTGIRHTRDF